MTADAYPFRGAVRWVALPSLLIAGGAVRGVGEFFLFAAWPVVGAASFILPSAAGEVPVGIALALGRRPLLALSAAAVLGALDVMVTGGLIATTAGVPAPLDGADPWMGVSAAMATAQAGAHLGFLRLRLRGAGGVAAGLALYAGAPLLGGLAAKWMWPSEAYLAYTTYQAVASITLNGLAMAVALRVAGRAAPRGEAPPPASDV